MSYLERISFQIAPDIVALFILTFLLFLVRRNEMISKEKTKFFMVTIYAMECCIIIEIIKILSEGSTLIGIRELYMITTVLGFSITPLVPILMAITFNQKIVKKIQFFIWPVIAYIFLCIQSSYTGLIFHISTENSYKRGPFYLLNAAILIYSFCIFLYSRKEREEFCDKRELRYVNYAYLLIGVGAFLQIVGNNIDIIWCCAALALLFYYIFIRELELKYDPLTMFMNYKYFVAHLEEQIKEKELTIVVLEATKLHVVNEEFGFLNGDHYIVDAAKVIQESFQKAGDIYRLSGGKFCVIIKQCKEKAISNCLCHMKLKMKKYKTEEVPLILVAGYACCQPEKLGKANKEEKLEAIRHCFYAAEEKLKEETLKEETLKEEKRKEETLKEEKRKEETLIEET